MEKPSKKNLIDKQSFEEYQEKEKQKNIYLFKIILLILLITNIIFIGFIILYKFQISTIQNDISKINTQLQETEQTNANLTKSTNKKFINIFSNVVVNKNLILEIFRNKDEIETVLNWANIDKKDIFLCFKSSYDNEDPQLMRKYCKTDEIIVMLSLENGKRLGGYIKGINLSDDKKTQYESNTAFLFSIDNMKKQDVSNGSKAFSVEKDGFFSFGEGDFVIGKQFRSGKNNRAGFPYNYGKEGDSLKELTGGLEVFAIDEMEIIGVQKIK